MRCPRCRSFDVKKDYINKLFGCYRGERETWKCFGCGYTWQGNSWDDFGGGFYY